MKTEPQLGHINGKKHDLDCRGCRKFDICQIRTDIQTLRHVNVKRAPNTEKYHVCHTIFPYVVARPPNNREDRRRFGETAVQY